MSAITTVHNNYQCDYCDISPIEGIRYHCTECEDYDECEKCHIRSMHQHLMERIDKCGKSKQLEILAQKISHPMLKQSLCPPPKIKKDSNISSVTKSALR